MIDDKFLLRRYDVSNHFNFSSYYLFIYIYMYVLRMHDGQRGSHQRDKHTVY